TKDLHTADYTQLYDFLKYNQKEVDELKAEQLAKTQDPLALMFRQYAGQNAGNLNGYNVVQNVRNQVAQNLRVQNVRNQNGPIGVQGNGNQNQIGNGNLVAKEEAGIQFQAEEYDLMVAPVDLDEIEEVNANCILMANLQQASSSSTQTDSTPIYDTDGSAE
nr:hypothetical protein [Tanacetum cinerariifolium]